MVPELLQYMRQDGHFLLPLHLPTPPPPPYSIPLKCLAWEWVCRCPLFPSRHFPTFPPVGFSQPYETLGILFCFANSHPDRCGWSFTFMMKLYFPMLPKKTNETFLYLAKESVFSSLGKLARVRVRAGLHVPLGSSQRNFWHLLRCSGNVMYIKLHRKWEKEKVWS